MKRLLLAVSMAAAVVLAMTAGTARADQGGLHFKFNFSDQNTYLAGTQCDFNYQDTFTVVVNGVFVPTNSVNPVELTEYVTHTNLDTGYSLSEVDHILTFASSSTSMTAGIFWNLRDSGGKLVLVKAGEATFDLTTGELISYTPNSAQDQ